jgi:hypothetical protein
MKYHSGNDGFLGEVTTIAGKNCSIELNEYGDQGIDG